MNLMVIQYLYICRENELLKHQLRKYVGAVQMLKRDGTQAHEALANLEASQPKAGESYPDYHHEAREYEKKLIQVSCFLTVSRA
jgi:sorting nexin-29